MNAKTLLGFGLITLSLTIGISSCSSKKTISADKEVGKIIEDLPCEDKGKSDKTFFRSFALATSSDLSLASEKALLLAKQRLVTLINSSTKSVTDRYANEREVTGATEFEQKFENLTREVANETLNNIVVVCEKRSIMETGQYRAFVAIEVSKEDILNGIQRKVSNNAKIQVDYDKKKYEEIYNAEMQKMADEKNK